MQGMNSFLPMLISLCCFGMVEQFSFLLPHSPTLHSAFSQFPHFPHSAQSPPPLPRFSLADTLCRVFLLHGLLSNEECDYLVNATECMLNTMLSRIPLLAQIKYLAIGFDIHSDVKNEYPEDYRSNQRLVVLSKPFADTIWRFFYFILFVLFFLILFIIYFCF